MRLLSFSCLYLDGLLQRLKAIEGRLDLVDVIFLVSWSGGASMPESLDLPSFFQDLQERLHVILVQ